MRAEDNAAPDAARVDVRLVDLTRRFGDVAAVDAVSLDIGRGEFFTLLGPSGSGKTTTLRLIAGFELPDAGRVELAGTDVTRPPALRARRQHGLPGLRAVPAHDRARERRVRAAHQEGARATERRTRAEEALAMVRLGDYGARKPAQLSGGQRQRVALARAIVNRPQVLLLDEPLGALDLKLRQEMQVELKRIQGEVGITFVYVTHDQEEALTMSDRLAVFNAGRIEQVGTPAEVYEHPGQRVRGRLRRRVERRRARRAAVHDPAREGPPAGRGRGRRRPARRGGHRRATWPTWGWSRATSSRSTPAESCRSSARTSRPPRQEAQELRGRRVRVAWRDGADVRDRRRAVP